MFTLFSYLKKLVYNTTPRVAHAVRSKSNKFLPGYIRILGFVLKVQEEVAAERVFPHLSQRHFADVNSQNTALDEEGKKGKNSKNESIRNPEVLGKCASARTNVCVCSSRTPVSGY